MGEAASALRRSKLNCPKSTKTSSESQRIVFESGDLSREAGQPKTSVAVSTPPRWPEGIAIVGMGAHFPGCPSVDKFWESLTAGANLLSQATDAEMRNAGVDP